MTEAIARRIRFLWFVLAAGAVLSIAPTHKIARMAKDSFPVLADMQDRISVAVGRPVAYADIQDYAHMPFFAVLTYLLLDFLTVARRVQFWKAVMLSAAVIALISFLLEGMQSYAPGRDPALSDVAVNSKGWLGGFIIYSCIWLSRSKK